MVSPENMIREVNPEDFFLFTFEDLSVYIQKEFVETQDKIEFLIPYFDKETITFQR